jgi:hypothetical protein
MFVDCYPKRPGVVLWPLSYKHVPSCDSVVKKVRLLIHTAALARWSKANRVEEPFQRFSSLLVKYSERL